MNTKKASKVQLIPIDHINILNPRVRNKKKFEQIVDNISHLGLKKPITVSRRTTKGEENRYNLVCGQGRLEAYTALGQTEIPAIVVDFTQEDCLLMSLVENLARKQHATIDLVREIEELKKRGYNFNDIAQKTDLHQEYVRGIIRLLEKGEERLVMAVERGQIPISIAMEIALSDDEGIQRALHQAYESKKLRGRKLINVRRLIDLRKSKGKSWRRGISLKGNKNISADALVRAYTQETERLKQMVIKARLCEARLFFIISAIKQLCLDENFVNLLRAESLDTLPKFIADKINE
jgi:ParB family transcriptional regulator, chromosome partitioning protein